MEGILNLSPLARDRWRRFCRIPRAYRSLWALGGAFVLSLFSDLIANDRPLCLTYGGRYFFPAFRFYPETAFGGRYGTEPDYHALENDPAFRANRGRMLFPPIPYGPIRSNLDRPDPPPHAPSLRHWLGTDSIGRDVLARLIHGFRVCMLFALALVAVSAVLGIVIGGVQGYTGGRLDIIFQRVIEIWAALPFLYVLILLGSIYGRSFAILLCVTAAFQWIGLSYYMRGEFFRLRDQTFVVASRALGAGHRRIIFQQILPNALGPVITILPFTLIAGIGTLTALDFLGFGLPPPAPSWGELLQQGLKQLYCPWIAFSAVAALFTTLMLASFIGEGAREVFDPRSKNRYD